MSSSHPTPLAPRSDPPFLLRCRATHLILGVMIVGLDLLTGPFFLFPILFVIPVVSSAWFCSGKLAHGLAIVLPLARLAVAEFVEQPHPTPYIVVNALVRMAVLLLLAFFVSRTAAAQRELRSRLESLVTICAWSKMIQFEGEWMSIEEYLRRRFGIKASHGISPEEMRKMMERLDALEPPKPDSPGAMGAERG